MSLKDEGAMTIGERVQADIVVAMKAKEEHKLTTLRMVKSALKNKEIDKREKLTDAEESQILTTLIKHGKDAGEDVIREVVTGAIDTMTTGGKRPGPKDMGAVMKVVQQRILADGLRAD